MSKLKTEFICSVCGQKTFKWQGRCPSCDEWDSLIEKKPESVSATASQAARLRARPEDIKVQPATNFSGGEETRRLSLGEDEFDNLLGGGLPLGAALLLGGEPGVGKSTLALAWAKAVSAAQRKTLYLCGEEAASTVALRAKRTGAMSENLLLCESMEVENVLHALKEHQPALIVLDSLQTLSSLEQNSNDSRFALARSSGAEYLSYLIEHCREAGGTLLIVGHVTKEGSIAGPKLIEHMVDAVLFFENPDFRNLRILRVRKNRFAPTEEIGVFDMTEKGLLPATRAASLFLEDAGEPAPGRCISPVIEGGRVFLVEIQALVCESHFPSPTRKVSGYDPVRVAMILAVLEKRLGLALANCDVYVNVVGGLKVKDTGADLAVAAALWSSLRNITINARLAAFGEIGLTGELRRVANTDRRAREAKKLGFAVACSGQEKKEEKHRRNYTRLELFLKDLKET